MLVNHQLEQLIYSPDSGSSGISRVVWFCDYGDHDACARVSDVCYLVVQGVLSVVGHDETLCATRVEPAIDGVQSKPHMKGPSRLIYFKRQYMN